MGIVIFVSEFFGGRHGTEQIHLRFEVGLDDRIFLFWHAVVSR